jgi:amino acid transporter
MALPSGGLGNVPFGVLAVASASGIYALNGYGGVVCFGEEIRDAQGSVGRIIYLALATGAAIVILPLAALIAASPDLNHLYHDPSPIIGFLHETGGSTLTTLVSLSVAGAIFNCMIAIALTIGRMLFASARDHAFPAPFNRVLSHLSPRFDSPTNATLVAAAAALPLCFAPLKILILVNGNVNIAIYGTLALGVIAGRRNGLTAHSQSRAILHPLAPFFVLACMAALTSADLMDPENGRPALLAAILIVAAGILYAEYVTRRNSAWRHRDAPSPAIPPTV